jgi:hypothetical protein
MGASYRRTLLVAAVLYRSMPLRSQVLDERGLRSPLRLEAHPRSMNWKALKDGKCPKDGAVLKEGGLSVGYSPALRCSNDLCDFKISETRFKEIVTSTPRRFKDTEDNLSEWNNYSPLEHSQSGT